MRVAPLTTVLCFPKRVQHCGFNNLQLAQDSGGMAQTLDLVDACEHVYVAMSYF